MKTRRLQLQLATSFIGMKTKVYLYFSIKNMWSGYGIVSHLYGGVYQGMEGKIMLMAASFVD